MQISQYMEKALFDSRDGFYQKENIYEHFCTPFSFNSSFKRFIAKYLISYNTSIFEVGPSSGGVLAEELLKLGFKKQLTLCEKSTLARKNLQSKFSSQSSVNISNDIPKLKDNTVVFLQEVLDCFSADWFKIEDKKLYSCYLDNDYQVLKKDIKQPYKCDYFQHIKISLITAFNIL